MKYSVSAAAFISLLLVLTMASSCGPNAGSRDLSADAITQHNIDDLVASTSLKLPPESKGLHYFYLGGRDPCLWAKLVIPTERKADFIANDVFGPTGEVSSDGSFLSELPWWQPKALRNAIGREQRVNDGHLWVYLGDDGGETIAYICWMHY